MSKYKISADFGSTGFTETFKYWFFARIAIKTAINRGGKVTVEKV